MQRAVQRQPRVRGLGHRQQTVADLGGKFLPGHPGAAQLRDVGCAVKGGSAQPQQRLPHLRLPGHRVIGEAVGEVLPGLPVKDPDPLGVLVKVPLDAVGPLPLAADQHPTVAAAVPGAVAFLQGGVAAPLGSGLEKAVKHPADKSLQGALARLVCALDQVESPLQLEGLAAKLAKAVELQPDQFQFFHQRSPSFAAGP